MTKKWASALLLLGSFVLAQSGQAGAQDAPKPITNPPDPAQVRIDPAKEADIRQLMHLTGSDKLATQMMTSMETNLRPSLTNSFPPGDYRTRLVDLFFEKLGSRIGPATTELTIPIYDKYFSDEEVQQLTAFYQTPVGAKAVKVLPELMSEVMTSSRAWAQELVENCMKEVLDEHPDLKQAMGEAQKVGKPQ